MIPLRARGVGRAAIFSCLTITAVTAPAVSAEAPRKERPPDEEILVTGTRIPRGTEDTLEPASVITSDYIRSRGFNNVADALNQAPGFGAGTTPEGDQSNFGPGLNFVNRFGLGSNRTLTLVDGRRFVTSNPPAPFGPAPPGMQVDLNAIPVVLVDRVETLSIGGAPVYGSDAIAGVVNVRLKRNFEGVHAFGQYGALDDGGMPTRTFGLVGGWNFAGERGNVTASIQHSESDGLLAIENPRFAAAYTFAANPFASAIAGQVGRTPANDGRVNPDIPFNTGNSDGIPNSVLIRDRRSFLVNFGGVALPTGANNLADGRLRCFGAANDTCLQFDSNGALVPYDPGTNFSGSIASGGDGMYLASTLQLATDLQRDTVTASGRFEVSDGFEVFADVLAYRAEARELVDQPTYNSAAFGTSTSGAIELPIAHPALTDQARATLAALQPAGSTFRLSRANRDLAGNEARSDSDLLQIAAGARGEFSVGARGFDWEAYINLGRNDTTYFFQALDRQKFVNALNVVSVGGRLECSVSPGYAGLPGGVVRVGGEGPVADSACVPLDIFGEGRASPAARDYVTSLQRVDAEMDQGVFNLNVGSTAFALPAGDVRYNVGFEHRRESGAFRPDEFLQAGRGRSGAMAPVGGSYSTNEFSGEVVVPLFSERNALPALADLTLTGKARHVDSSLNGGFTAWTGGLQWSPVRGLQLRGNVTRSMRSPSIVELYLPVTPLFTTVGDPCSTANLGAGGDRQDARTANCREFFAEYGLPADGSWVSNATTSSVEGTSQGDPELRNERADAWSAGFVLQPEGLRGLELAVDWVDVRIEDVITSLSSGDLARACFDNYSYPNRYCNYFTRQPPGSPLAGQISFVQSGYVNGAFQSMEGITAEGRYHREFGGLGEFGFELRYFGLREELRSATGLVTTDTLETIGSPKHSAQLQLTWRRGRFGAAWQTNYVSGQLYSRDFDVEARDILEVGSSTTHDLSANFAATGNLKLWLAVTNLFDAAPPFPIAAEAFNGNYDFLGRRYALSVAYDFGAK